MRARNLVHPSALLCLCGLGYGCFNPDPSSEGGTDAPSTASTSIGTSLGVTSSSTGVPATESGSFPVEGTEAGSGATDSSEESCEVGAQQSCWETENGEPLPELEGELQGECRYGLRTCQDDGTWGPCRGAVAPADADSCGVAGADDDCNGIANEDCPCSGAETRECGTSTGNCSPGTQTCRETGTWSNCEGGIVPAARDACDVQGDDANCNGVPNEGCECTTGVSGACDDGITCTDDTCVDGTCRHTVQPSSCLIDDRCYSHNQNRPSSSCQYCNVEIDQRAWTNWSSATSCDDGVWCNGSDHCDGSGSCVHEFPNGDRCRGNGPCDRRTCSEADQTCYEPNTTVCDETTEFRCSATNTCGSQTQTRTVQRLCSGASSSCDGGTQAGSWRSADQCSAAEICNDSSHACETAVECVGWCDPATDLCWMQEERRLDWPNAEAYCNAGTWGERTDWRVPTVAEWITVLRGCTFGEVGDEADVSSCTMQPEGCVSAGRCDGTNACTSCPSGQGPDTADDDCYWHPALEGSCGADNGSEGYWTSTLAQSTDHWLAYPYAGYVYPFGSQTFTHYVRCVTER